MNIIFDHIEIDQLRERHIVLPLDTFRLPDGKTITAHCVIESLPLDGLFKIEAMTELHNNLISNFQSRNWEYCKNAIPMLIGAWGGEVDTFYLNLQNRVDGFIQEEPAQDWSPIIQR